VQMYIGHMLTLTVCQYYSITYDNLRVYNKDLSKKNLCVRFISVLHASSGYGTNCISSKCF